MHEVQVNRLGGLSLPRKSVVRLTDRPDMTLDVYRGRETTMQHVPAGPRVPMLELEIPQQICRNLVVENIGNKDDHCYFWTLRWSSMCENGKWLSKACPCRKKDCIFATMCGIGLETTTACITFLADNGGVGRTEVPPIRKGGKEKL